jgi:hypothetical protein
MSDVLFIQREDLIRYTLIGGNVDTDKIIPHIKVAQDIHILPILGTLRAALPHPSGRCGVLPVPCV